MIGKAFEKIRSFLSDASLEYWVEELRNILVYEKEKGVDG